MKPAPQQISTLAPIIAANGMFLLILGVTELFIGLVDYAAGQGHSSPFLISGLITTTIGVVALYLNGEPGEPATMSRRQVFATLISAWLSACLAAALPFMLGAPHLTFSFAVFESVSALTTTGATVMTGLDNMPKSILFFRSILHWYGGMGVIIGAIVLFPAMRVGGMQLFVRAGFENHDKFLPSARAVALATFLAYSLVTLICAIGLTISGIGGFDSVNLSMSIMATGGMAVSDSSFGNYGVASHWIATFFMMIAGMPLITTVLFLRGNLKAFAEDLQIRAFLIVYFTIFIGILAYRVYDAQGSAFEMTTTVAFNTASMLTGTGLTNGDFQLWGSFPTMLLFMAMLIGGCTGSTAGSVKIFRYQVLIELIRVRIKAIHHPHGVFTPKYGGQKLDDNVIESVAAFFVIYLATLAVLTISFDIWGLDLLTGFSAAVSAVGNVGPGLGDVIGPVGNYSSFNLGELWTYTTCMIVGRLEFMAIMVIVLPRFWKH